MAATVWNPGWVQEHTQPLAMHAFRMVETQHIAATMRLVDTAAEQDLLEQLLAAQSRDAQIAAGKALDRVLLWQHYIIPNWYINYHRLAYRNRFAFVTTPPYTLGLNAWWLKTSEKAQ